MVGFLLNFIIQIFSFTFIERSVEWCQLLFTKQSNNIQDKNNDIIYI